MNTHLIRAGVGLGATAALVSSMLLTTVPAADAVGDGTLTVNLVDQYGRPVANVVAAFDPAATQYDDDVSAGGAPVAGSTHTFTLPPGGYSLVSLGLWSGADCAGASPCYTTTPEPPTIITPVVQVTEGATSTYTMHVTVPSVTGANTVGSPLTLQLPKGLTDLQWAYGGVVGFPAGPGTQQWMRGATDIPGATGTSYTTVRDDGAQAVSARLTPSPGMALFLGTLHGSQTGPFTTNSIGIAPAVKAKTKTKTTAAKSVGVGDPVSVKVKVTAKIGGDPDGYVTLTMGQFKVKKKLRDGVAFIRLPHLNVGQYVLVTKYGGSDGFKKSKAKRTTLTVHA